MEGFCRGCLIKYNEPTELLHYTEKNRRLFIYSTGLQAKRNDTFTFQLCKDCYVNMKLSCKFKKQCRSSDKRYKNYLALREAGENIDFCTFLKNNDDSLTFKFSSMYGSSTPGYQRYKDEDNESTSTSIRNFITDIMQNEEIPDTEARIIQEVIEEEADVLDESLDSHWLQDDMSIDTDFRLDFNYSPFSTPQSEKSNCTPVRYNEDTYQEPPRNCCTAQKMVQQDVHKYNFEVKRETTPDKDCLDIDYLHSIERVVKYDERNDNLFIPIKMKEESLKERNEYCITNELYKPPLSTEQSLDVKCEFVDNMHGNGKCTIDKNLHEALKDKTNNEFSLDDLLTSPPVFPAMSAASTPTIRNILFGDKLDDDYGLNARKVGHCIEKYDDLQGDMDMLEEFFNQNEADNKRYPEQKECTDDSLIIERTECAKEVITNVPLENKFTDTNWNCTLCSNRYKDFKSLRVHLQKCHNKKIGVQSSDGYRDIETVCDIENSYCMLCKKQYKDTKCLKIHFAKLHKLKIFGPSRVYKRKPKIKICDHCGKEYLQTRNLILHIKTHIKPKEIQICHHCNEEFSSEAKLKMHMASHRAQTVAKEVVGKKYYCPICGASSSSQSNFRIHQLRHTQDYKVTCQDCGKGFFRKSELTEHMRTHTKERPFACNQCKRTFTRRHSLFVHMRRHTGHGLFTCSYCETSFTTNGHLQMHIAKSITCKKQRRRSQVEDLIKPNVITILRTPIESDTD